MDAALIFFSQHIDPAELESLNQTPTRVKAPPPRRR
jgi:hypothetical protein